MRSVFKFSGLIPSNMYYLWVNTLNRGCKQLKSWSWWTECIWQYMDHIEGSDTGISTVHGLQNSPCTSTLSQICCNFSKVNCLKGSRIKVGTNYHSHHCICHNTHLSAFDIMWNICDSCTPFMSTRSRHIQGSSIVMTITASTVLDC